ncbi:nesprin-1 isoform X4 [Larimichthys crocea]|uniref:nesprin-1 isoform X4 n=1 Tax=Larimichthys crocea TaxID=215358 RepID=UPI000F5DCB76|nr:nesprin-1 isoform X4 [Larimichthys crocea]
MQALSGTCTSERVIKEHRTFFRERKPLTLCEKRIRNMEDLCHKLPDNDPAYRMLDSTRRVVEEVTEQIKSTHLKLEQHPDKWKEWNERFCELSDWLSSQRRQVRLLRETARNSSHQEQVDAAVQTLQEAIDAREENLLWLKSRLTGLSDVSSELEVQRQRTALGKLSTDLRALFSSLCQWGEEGSAMFQYEELGEEVRGALEEVLRARREVEEQTSRILEAEGLEEAKQLHLIHQQNLKRLHANRRDAELLVSHCRQVQKGEGLSQSLRELEGAFREVDRKSGAKEHNLQATLSSWQNFETERETVWRFISNANNELHKELIFNSLDSLKTELEHNKELLTKVEECSVRAELLLEKAADIQLGPKNHTLLLQQAQSTREAVTQLHDHLNKNVVQLEMMCMWWERFSSESEAFSLWINEKEKELEAVNSTSSLDPLDKHISTVEAVGEGLEERRAALAHMEADCEALSRFVTPGEAGHIRARLTQMRRCWEELKGRVEQLGGQLNQNATYRQRYNDNLEQVKKTMSDLEEKLDCPITYCTSSSETYKGLQEHMEVCQAVEQLNPRLMALCSAMKRLGEGSQLEEEVANLKKQQGEFMGKAAEKQSTLETLLALWQRFEKESSSMKSWLDRCESVCRPDTDLLSADKVKLRNELLNVEEMQRETPSYEALLNGLVNLGLCLYPTAPEARIHELTDDLKQIQERCTSIKNSISHRLELLKPQLEQLEQFDQALLTLTQTSENFLSGLRSSSQVDIADLEVAITKLKEHEVQLQAHASLRENLQQRESSLLLCSTPEAQQQLLGWREDCLQPLSESQRLLLLRKECLTELKTFLEKHGAAAKAVRCLHEAVEGRGSWDRSKAEELHRGIGEVAKDVARLEAEAVGLDGQLSKAHLHLCGAEWRGSKDVSHPQGRTSCRGQAVALTMALEEVQRGVGWRQSEADALAALWSSFRERREEVMKNLKKLEDEARQEGARESSVQAFQNRLRFFVQLEDELQSLQHSQQWLEEKGSQLAHRDSELAGEALREVALVKTAWENVKTLITNGQEQSGVVVDLLRQFQQLKSTLTTVVENAQAVAHNLPDHNHNAQEAKRTFTRHETVQSELRDKQEDMDQLISTVEDLQRELEKVPNSNATSIQKDMETLRDQWLEVSERIQTNTERLGYCVALWDDLKSMEQDVNQWTANSIADLTDSVTNLSDKEQTEALLATFQAEVEKREQRLDALQERVTELQERARLQETPLQMQVLESDLRKKMSHAQEVYNQAKHTLTYFSFQKQRLEDLMSQMAERLKAVEGSLSDLTEATSPEDIGTVKDLQSIVQQQRADMDSARDALSALCRSHPSQELSCLSSDLTSIAKRTEAVAQRCAKTRGNLQDELQLHFNELVQDFHLWLADLKLELKECANQSGDVAILGTKLQRLKISLEQTSEGEEHLSQVCEEAERLQLHLPKAGAAQVQEHLLTCHREWRSYLENSTQSQRDLEESIHLLKNFNGCVEGIKDWLKQMDLSLKSEPVLGAESQQGATDTTEELEKMENLHKELLAKRDSIERLCQEAQSLSETGRGSGGEVRVTGQLQMEHQALLKAARERLRGCQESQAFGETLQGVWAWLEEIQERLGTVDSTMGTKEQLEQRLETVQDILLLKGEGEVKLNMAMGKGELALRSYGATGQEVVRSQLQEVEDAWATLLVTAMSCHSRLEWTVSQWGGYLESAAQLRCWMEAVEREVCAPLTPQPGPREKASHLERLRALLADLEDHQVALSSLEEKARELFKKTGDASFNHGARTQLQVQFDDLTALVEERVRLAQAVVLEHQEYLEAVRELTDWLMTAGEELQHWSDTSGDSASIKRKLSEVRERVECRLLEGRERLSRVRRSAASTAEHTAAGGCEAMDRQLGALSQALEQWEGAALRARDGLEGALATATASEEEYDRLTARLEDELKELDGRLRGWSQELIKAEGRSNGEEAVEGWQQAKDILEGLQSAEPMADKLKGQLNDLVRYSRDLGSQSDRVTALIKQHNSLSLRASRECQNKERLLEQRFRAALRDFQQWLVNAKISTAKCFDVPQSVAEASTSLQRIQEFLSDREHGQARLSTVGASGELLMAVVSKDRVEGIKAKVANAREDWKSLMNNLQMREDALKNLQSQMTEFEASAEPLQDWLNSTEVRVQESSARLHDLPAKKQELSKLQCVLEEMASREAELGKLRERAHRLWEGQAAGKGFVHRVSQLSAQYLALSNLTKDKASRIERIVGEHRLFSQGLKELQDWVCEAQRVLSTCISTTTDKGVLEDRMLQLEALLAARQEREIQLKMLLTRGEAVQRNTSAEGVPVIRKQIQDLKDSWDSLLSASIQCKSQLEGALSQWTSYQEDVGQFVLWMDRVEETLSCSDRQYSEMRDKTANLGKTKLLYEEVLSHSSPLETIATKGSNMAEHYTTQQEVQQLQCRYNTLKEKAKNAVSKAKGLVLVHQEYQRGLHVFEDWLEQEQATLASLSHPEGNVDTLEKTLLQLQLLQEHCSNGQSLLSSVLTSRERVIPWGIPQIEDRALDTVQREWGAYQGRLEETQTQLSSTLTRLRQMGQKFLSLAQWLEDMEKVSNIRRHRRSDRAIKETQLKKLQGSLEAVLARQGEVDGLSSLAQQVLEETYISSRVSVTATQLTARYHSLLLNIQDTIKQLQEELKSIEEADNLCVSFTDWFSSTQKSFTELTDSSEPLDRIAMERKMKKLETLQSELQHGHGFLKSLRERAEKAAGFLNEAGAESLGGEVEARLAQLEELAGGLRQKHSFLQRALLLAKEFQDRYKAQAQWLVESRALLSTPVEPKAELYQRRALLAKYKALLQMVQSHDGSIRSVVEKGDALLASVHYPSIRDKMNRLKKDYAGLCDTATAHVENLESQVKEQEAYHNELQEVERWLLQMSSRMVTPDPTVGGSLEAATQQLARHKAIMEEIAGFEDRLAGLKERGAHLVQGCSDRVQSRLRQQVQAHQQGTRDSYSAICSTAQRVYQSLDHELQRHVSLQDTLQQCQTWLTSVSEEPEPPSPPPLSLDEALQQVKQERALQEQASTYLQLVCSACDLSEPRVRETAGAIQQVKLQIEERMLLCEEVADSWRDIEEQKADLEVQLRETEQQLQNLIRRPAELEPKIAQNQLDKAQEFLQQIRERQSEVTHLNEATGRLTDGQVSPALDEIRRLRKSWMDLGQRAEELEAQRGEDMQRSGEYQEIVVAVEELFHQVSREWDYLARADTESTSEHLEALRKLSSDLEEQRATLEDLRDQRQAILPRLSLLDKELVKQQVGHLEQRWSQLETLIQQKIQDSAQTLDDLARVESQLKDAREWVEEQRPALTSALKTSPPPDLAQSFLFDHLSVCVELEARQQLLGQAVSEAQAVASRLGLSEKRCLQELVEQAQTEVEALGARVAQRRKYLSKAFTERTQFLQGLGRALSWVQQQERKALIDDHIALLPEDLAKQVAACRGVQSGLRAYQRELASLWVQGRELERDATDKERAETLARLEKLQAAFETALQRTTQRLTDLEKALTSRKYFQVDLDKTCHWLRRADAITFPEINLSNTDDTSELQTQLLNFQNVLEQASEYENLLLIVQRIGQEILPTLNEIDHCYLDERLNALPQQYNAILALAKEKKDRVQQIILEQKEFSTFFDITRNALEELREQFDNLEKQTISIREEELVCLINEHRNINESLFHISPAVRELHGKNEGFLSRGQQYRAEETHQLVSQHNTLKRMNDQKIKHLDDCLKTVVKHNIVSTKLDSELKSVKEKLARLKSDTEQGAMDKITHLYSLLESLDCVSSQAEECNQQTKGLCLKFDPAAFQETTLQLESLQSLRLEVKRFVEESETKVTKNEDFTRENEKMLEWLRTIKDQLEKPLTLSEIKTERVYEEMRKLKIVEEEVKSRLRIGDALGSREKQRYFSRKETVPAHIEEKLQQLAELGAEVQRGISKKQLAVDQVLSLVQRHHLSLQSMQTWLDSAVAVLQRASLGVELEDQTDCVQDLEDISAQEKNFIAGLEELETLNPLLEDLMEAGVTSELRKKVEAMQLRNTEVKQQLDAHREVLQSCAALWTSFQHEKETLVEQMNDAERKMAMYTTAKAISIQQAEEKCQRYMSLVAHINLLELPLNAMKENAAELEQIISESSKAVTSHSVSSLWQRWTRLRSVARAQERALEDTAREWRNFTEKMEKVRTVSQDLHGRVPDSTVEKAATRAALQSLLEYHDSFSLEVEREQSILALLGQHTRSLRGEEEEEEAMEKKTENGHAETPCLQEIRSMQEQYECLVMRVRASRAQVHQELREREEVEKELGLVKGWIQDTRGLLLSPTADLDSLLQELETAHGEVISRRQSVERMTELQQSKYQDLHAGLPSELSMQLAEVTLALGSAEDQVQAREREVQQTRDVKEDFSSRLQDIEAKLKTIALKLEDKGADLEEAKEETKALCEECECCGRSLAELGVAVQEFGEQNPLLCKQLGDAVAKLTEVQRHTTQQVQDRANRLKKAERQAEEYQGMRAFILGWTEKAEALVTGSIIWSSASQLQEQIRAHQALLRECRGLHGDLEAMGEREGQLGEVLQTAGWIQQVKHLSRCTEELQQTAKTRLQSLQDAAKDMSRLEAEVKNLHAAIDQIQVTLASPDLNRLSLREQLTQRQRLLVEMEGFKQQVAAVQQCQSALRLPEEVVASLPICRTAQSLQQEASQLQHTTIQQCNILQEAVVQYEQYEQEVKNLQRLIEEAHRIIQDRPVSTNNIQELQAQIHHHEELAQKIRGYQEQIASLHSKCKMLTVKAKHATMLLTVSEVDGLSDGMDELSDEELPSAVATAAAAAAKQLPAHPSVVMMTAGRCHTLLSPVTEESGEEGTNSEVSSPPACRSPSPGANADAPLNQGRGALSRAPLQELYDPSMETSAANLDDLQRSWETLKNVISEKQKSLYEALERQQHYQESLQSISTKMESIEGALSEGLEPSKSPESQMAAHQALMDEILMLQDEIGELQTCFSEELADSDSDGEAGDQLALQSTLTVLGERMATIRMKASGKRQLLEERLSEQLEEQRQEQALQRYHSEAEELDHWLLSTRATLSSALQPLNEDLDMEEQLIDCQNMLFEIEQKVSYLSELSVHSESLLLEGRAETKGEAEQLTFKLRSLKDSLMELQQMLQDKQIDIQGSLQELEDSEPDSSLSQSPNVQDWLSQARSTRTQQHHDNLLRQRELQEQVAEQRRLLQSVANVGEELLSQQTTPNGDSEVSIPGGVLLETDSMSPMDQLRQRWENLNKDQSTKLKLSLNTLDQDQLSPVLHRSRLSSPSMVFRGESVSQDSCSPRVLFEACSQTLERIAQEAASGDSKLVGSLGGTTVQQDLYAAVSAASSWLDAAENQLLSGPVLLSEDTETQLTNLEGLNKQLKGMTGEVNLCRDLLGGGAGRLCGGEEQGLMEETLEGLQDRMGLLDSTLEQHCDGMRDRLQEHSTFQNELRMLFTALSESKHLLLQKMAGIVDRPASKQIETLSEVEDSLREFEQRVTELKNRAEGLQSHQISNQELLKLQDAYEELVLMVGSRRSSLNHGLSLKAQYEAALHDLTDLVDTAQDKMAADQKMTVASVIEVQMLLDKHKEFFQGLECHMILTQTFYSKVSGLVAQRESQTLEETMGLAHSVLKQAHRRGVELEGILESWSRLVEDYQALCRQLEAVECSIPTVGLVEETEERLVERISLFQRLKASLTEHQPQLYQLLEEGKRLLLSVGCSDLENQLTQLGEHWLSSTTKVNKELHRLDSTLKHWSRYQSESAELSHWLQSALDRLEFWTTQSVTVPQELETVRDHLYAFLEFSKEVDAKSSLRSSVLSTGNQLLRLKRVDTAGLRTALGQIDTQWAELLTRIPVVQEKLHQLQMEKLASRHAITELMSWISLMENIIEEDQDKIMGAVGSEVVQNFLQKYKGFNIDLTCKQLTVDFVNQSVLQISSQDVEGKRSDKTDFAEKLGAMNRRWQILQGLIGEKIQLLEGLLEGWLEHENGVQALKTWLTLQEEKLKKIHRIEDVASVQNALKDCQELEELVKEKEKELEKTEERGNALIQDKKGVACSVVKETLKGLNQSWAHLDHMISQMKVSLRSVLEQWTLYRRASEEINGYLMEGRYSVSRLCLLNGSLEAVQQQVESLENLQEEMDKQESSLRKFGSVTHQLLTECHPSVVETLNRALRDVNVRWNGLLEQISEQLRSSKALLGLWQRYKLLYGQCVTAVQKQEERADRLLKSATDREITEEESSAWITDCSACLGDQASVQQSLQQLQALGEQLKSQVDASSSAALQSDHLSLTHHLATLEHALHRQQEVLQSGSQACEGFREQLDTLIRKAEEAEEVLKESDPVGSPELTVVQTRMEKLKVHLLKLSSLSPDLERVNELVYRLPVSDRDVKRLQSLNRAWAAHSAHLTERFSKLQAVLLQQQSFLQKCEAWMDFLSETEQKLAAEISGNYQSLLEQQRDHELFQAEMFSRQQILYSIISDGHRMLDQGQMDDRDDFSVKLALLSNQWQGVVRRAQQRRGIIDSLVRQWQNYHEMAAKLLQWLQEVTRDPDVHQPGEPVALQQARNLLDQIQLRERVLQRQQGGYILTVEAGRSLLLSADAEAESTLQTELMEIQERWRHAHHRLDQQRRELHGLLKNCERCEKGINASLEKLRAFKRKLSVPLPDHHEELHSEQIRCKELESSVEGWTDDLTSLFMLRDSLEGVVSADDITVLQERLQLLQRQWEEVCHQLSLRRQQVSEKLNEWAVFNEKNKELCEWLTQMESKVSQNGDISIEEMIEKLRKDYQEEISVAQENKHQLQVMGERLARSSQDSKAAEIRHKLSKVSERWQHLLDLIAARVKKLRETLVAVQQLDKNMSSLRSWLAHIETELSRPIVYNTCDDQEIQRKLNQQQELQRDIEKHSTGVASVLNLCEVLLHDCDACSTETECDSIQQATRGLDRRWRNICAMSMERRLKIEETWRLWQKFLDDYSRFEDWLKTSERTAALPNSSGVLYTVAKEELKKFEAFQRQVQEYLTQLELINKQYRRLARENRTDSSCRLKEMVHDGNRRWDNLQKRVAAILRRLKHFISQREEFETARDSILVWLTEMDLQLTNIEHFSECDVQAKIKQLRAFQQEIYLNMGKIDMVFRQGDSLIEKSEPLDAAVIEEELEELQRYYHEVFGRVDRYYKKLTRLPLADDELDGSDRELDMEEGGDLSELQWGDSSLPRPSSRPASGTTALIRADRSGRDTPASVDSIPLEWDHDYDLSRGLESPGGRGQGERSHGEEEEDEYLRTAATVLSDVVIPESPEAYIKLTENTLKSSSGEPGQLEASLRQLDQALDAGRYHLQQREDTANSSTPDIDSTYMGYMRLMGECRGSIDAVKRAEGELTEDEDDMPGLTNPTSTDTQGKGVIERWELIQAQSLSEKHRHKQNLQQWQQLISDLQTMRAWLGQSEAELSQLRGLDLSTDIHTIQQRIKKLKELLKGMDAHKSQVLSINLSSADFLQSEPNSEEAWELRDGLKEMNARWDRLGTSLEDWREELQRALMQCQEFHEMSHGLLLWLENIDRRRNEVVPIPPKLDRETLRAHHRTLTQIKRELLDSQQKVSSLQELSAQLLVNTKPQTLLLQSQASEQIRAQGSECLEAQEKVHVILNRLRLLLREVSSDLEGLERRLEAMDTRQDCLPLPAGKSENCRSAGSASEVTAQSRKHLPEQITRRRWLRFLPF